MLKSALAVTALVLLTLALLLMLLPPRHVSTLTDLAPLIVNQKVTVSDVVVIERTFSSEKRLVLASGIEARCTCRLPALKDKRISVEGTLQRYQNKTWIEAHALISGEQP